MVRLASSQSRKMGPSRTPAPPEVSFPIPDSTESQQTNRLGACAMQSAGAPSSPSVAITLLTLRPPRVGIYAVMAYNIKLTQKIGIRKGQGRRAGERASDGHAPRPHARHTGTHRRLGIRIGP